jgi:hypothetical protein
VVESVDPFHTDRCLSLGESQSSDCLLGHVWASLRVRINPRPLIRGIAPDS